MKVRILHQFFHPDLSATSRVISEVAFFLAERGDEVSVLCSRNRYHGAQRDTLPARERIRGVLVRRCWGPSVSRRTLGGRVMNIVSFCAIAGVRALCSRRADTVVLMTDPPFFPVLGALLKRIRKERFVYVLMDLYPEVAIRAGTLREGSRLTRALRRVSTFALRWADAVVVLGEEMEESAIRAGADPDRVVVIRNWADPGKIFPVPHGENRFRRELGLEGKFVIEYSGNLGITHGFEDLLAVAEELAGEERIRFLFIGDGARRREVEAFAISKRLPNVLLVPYQDDESLSESLSAGDVHFVSLRKGFEGLVVPSKAYGIMAAGRPILYQGERRCEIARMVEREGIGFVVPPGDRRGLRERILFFSREDVGRMRMGETARRALEERYSPAEGLARYREVIAPPAS